MLLVSLRGLLPLQGNRRAVEGGLGGVEGGENTGGMYCMRSLATRRGIEMPHDLGCLGPFPAIFNKQLVKVSQSFSHQLPFKSRKKQQKLYNG